MGRASEALIGRHLFCGDLISLARKMCLLRALPLGRHLAPRTHTHFTGGWDRDQDSEALLHSTLAFIKKTVSLSPFAGHNPSLSVTLDADSLLLAKS